MLTCDCGWEGIDLRPDYWDNTARCPECNMVFEGIPAKDAEYTLLDVRRTTNTMLGDKRYCICQSIAGLEQLIAKGKKIDWLMNDDGTPATMQEICAAIVEAKAKGYTVLPPCDNVTSTGHCAGHDIEVDTT